MNTFYILKLVDSTINNDVLLMKTLMLKRRRRRRKKLKKLKRKLKKKELKNSLSLTRKNPKINLYHGLNSF